MADAIEFFGGDPRLDVVGNHLQHIGGKFAGNAHFCDVLWGFEGDGHTGSLYAQWRFQFGMGSA
ncbi:hypothetical protein D3C71_2050160 [compost metagenome]